MSGPPGWLVPGSGALTASFAAAVYALTADHLARTSHAQSILQRRAMRLTAGVAAGVLGAGAAWRLGAHPDLLVVGWLVVIAPALVGLDLLEQRLPDALTLGSYPVVAVLIVVEAVAKGAAGPIAGASVGLLLVGGFYLVAAALVAAGGGLGAGDVKLAGLVGIVMGSLRVRDAIIATIIGLVIAAIIGGVIIARSRNTRVRIAMGPAILSGALVTVFIGGCRCGH